jgi:hypothetical protein
MPTEPFWGRYWVVIAIAGFLLGFIVVRLFLRKKKRALKGELEDVRQEMQNAEMLISKQLGGWARPEGAGHVVFRSEPVDASEHAERVVPGASSEFGGNRLSLVRLTKVQGREGSPFKVGYALVGYDERLPEVGKSYRILTREGEVFATSEVTRVDSGLIHTRNSIYRIEFFEEEKSEDAN